MGLGSSWYGISGVEKMILSDSQMIWISNTGPIATTCACVHAKSLSRVRLCATLRTVAWQAPLFTGFISQEYWSGLPCPPSGDLLNSETEPKSPSLQAVSFPTESQGKPKNTGVSSLSLLQEIFWTQESNQDFLHCRWILYQLSYQGSPQIPTKYVSQITIKYAFCLK